MFSRVSVEGVDSGSGWRGLSSAQLGLAWGPALRSSSASGGVGPASAPFSATAPALRWAQLLVDLVHEDVFVVSLGVPDWEH